MTHIPHLIPDGAMADRIATLTYAEPPMGDTEMTLRLIVLAMLLIVGVIVAAIVCFLSWLDNASPATLATRTGIAFTGTVLLGFAAAAFLRG